MKDARGLEVTSESRACVAALDAARDSYLGFRADVALHVNAALKADPACVLANAMKGYLVMLLSNAALLGAVDERLEAARPGLALATKRERLHVQALRAWRRARNDEAIAAWEAILDDHPGDLVALRLAHFAYFWTAGDARRMRASIERAMRGSSPGAVDWGWLIGMHSFACEEAGDYALAERQGRDAVARNPADLWAIHAVAHVMEMQARQREGWSWVEANEAPTEGATNFKFHLAWHRALFLLEGGRREEVLDAYDRRVRDLASPLVQAQPDLYIDVQNAAAMLMRLELLGVDVGGRWGELADKAERRIGDHVIMFTLPHWMMALAATGRWARAEALIDAARDAAARSDGSEADILGRVAIAACLAVRAHRRGEFAAAVDALFPVRGEIVRLGGSHAQRDILWQIQVDAAMRAGRAGQARQLIDEVAAARPKGSLPALYQRIARQLAA